MRRKNKSQELGKVSSCVIDCTHDAAKYNEDLQDRPPKQQEEIYVGLPIHQLTKPLKMSNSTSTDVIYTGASYRRIVEKH